MTIEYIDGDESRIAWKRGDSWHYADLDDLIRDYESMRNVPTIDCVEVVRCKDCKHYLKETDNRFALCELTIRRAKADGFCAWGER